MARYEFRLNGVMVAIQVSGTILPELCDIEATRLAQAAATSLARHVGLGPEAELVMRDVDTKVVGR